jgi:hypothetical protein
LEPDQKNYKKTLKGRKNMLSQLKKYGSPDVLVPIELGDVRDVKKRAMWLHEKFGFTRFCLVGLTKGHRCTGYPTSEDYEKEARKFAEIREWMRERGLSAGWICNLTVKSGPSEFTPIIKADGSHHPFANCPFDEGFAARLADDIAGFAATARPDFVFLEDDFSVGAAQGCFCERHLRALAEKLGKPVSREELCEIIKGDDADSLKVRRAFADVKRESLVYLAKVIKSAFDRLCPDIPLGLEQSGASDADGNMTEEVTLALAGENHTPFVRLHGTFYCGFETKLMPGALFYSLYKTEHLNESIIRYHETDSYPHMRYYTSGTEIVALASAAYSYGMVGSVFFAQQFLDEPWEEEAYVKHFVRERKRLKALCTLPTPSPFGVEITYDPFYGSVGGSPAFPKFIGRLGIPFTTKRASVAFWDGVQAKYRADAEVLDYLSRGLILDGDAARILTERGFGKHLGVSVGEPLTKKNPRLWIDLGAMEVITDGFALEGLGREMYPAHAYCPKGGKEWLEVTVTDEKTEIVSEARDFRGNLLSPAMTYFENELGGKVCVISQSLNGNSSQSVYNYRRAALLQNIIAKMSDEYPFVGGAPDIYMIAALRGRDTVLTLINLCTDEAEDVKIYLPASLRLGEILTVNSEGEFLPLDAQRVTDGIILAEALRYCKPYYIVIKEK